MEIYFSDIDECIYNHCYKSAECKEDINSNTCECKKRFTGNGSKCSSNKITDKLTIIE